MMTTRHMKTLALSALLLLMPFGVSAQNNERALAIAVDKIILSDMNPKVVDEFVEEIYQKHGKKSAFLASRIAKSYYQYSTNAETKERYFGRKEVDTAFVFINRAITIDPKYPDPYILAADILKYEKGSEGRKEAMQWLDRGIAANPVEPSLYVASAQILALSDSEAAVAKLNALKQSNPDFPVELELGRLYWNMYNDIGGTMPFQEMAAAYDKVDRETMTVGDLEAYSFALYATNQIDKMYDISSYGVTKFPESFMLNKNVFYGLLGLNRYKEAVQAGEKFIANAAFEKNLAPLDYLRYGEALVGDKQYEKAIEQYNFVLNMEKATESNRNTANSHIESAINDKINGMMKLGEYDQALRDYANFLQERKSKGLLTASMLSMYAKIYQSQAEEQNGLEKEATLMKADKVYVEMQREFPKFDDLAVFNRYIIHNSLDPAPDYPKGGIAKPLAEQLISLLANKSEMTSSQQYRLTTAYWYLCYWNAVADKGNRKLAVEYADKILELDPTHSGAQKIREVFNKKR